MTAGEYGGGTRLLPDTLMQSYKRPEHTIPESNGGHYWEWLNACKGDKPAGSNFDYAGPFTEIVLLGNVALRAGQPIEWDPVAMEVTNVPEANALISKKCRAGWSV